jgi:hypothetical protein
MVPQELRDRPQWLVWRFEHQKDEKKPRKVPYYVNGQRRQGTQGSEDDRLQLVLFDAAINEMSRGKYDGVGFAFLPGDGLIGIDLDNCIDHETGEIQERAQKIIAACSSYTELSPSKRGVHIFVKGQVDRSFKSNQIGVEVFCGSQFFTFTGEHFSTTPQTVNEISEAVLRRLKLTVEEAKTGARSRSAGPVTAQSFDTWAKVQSALPFIPPDLGYEEWLQIGMAVHAELGDGAFSVWDQWSARGAKYPGSKQLESHWRSFTPGGGITGATLFKMARDAGWRPPGRPKASNGAAAGEEAAAEKPKKRERGGGFNFGRFFKQFALIYPTETAWDAELEKIVKVSAMRLKYGKGVVDFWLTSTDPRSDLVRRCVNEQDVVFDPSCSCDPKTTVNLFRGMPLKPDGTKSCEKLIGLLRYLCREDEEANTPISDWVQKWIAYPLQNRGAKMQTAVVMYGHEGTGKNLFWDAVATIYGEYGGFITQFQLQSQFNDWASRKMFVVANEVLTRMELRHMVGYLKNLITEKRIPIETKNMPVRIEDNRMQLVFLSNELQPLVVAPGDRRYMVIRTATQREPDYYAGVGAELAAGGVQGLYHYLLNLDLGDFNAHTKPVATEAKRDLVRLGMSMPQLYWQEIKDGLLALPYIPAHTEDHYRAFKAWCAREGDKNPPKMETFSQQFMSMNGVTRKTLRISDPSKEVSLESKQRRVFLMGEQPDGMRETAWADACAKEFHAAMLKYVYAGRSAQEGEGDGSH